MFGYVTANRPELKVKDLEKYRSYYCGVCSELHRRYGRRGQLLLSYDCTFIAILLTGLYEPEEGDRMTRCLAHPELRHHEVVNRFSAYAADMNVLLGYLKAADDWKDERKASSRALLLAYRKDYLKARERRPRQERAVRRAISSLHGIERQGLPEDRGDILRTIDAAAGAGGRMFGEVCVPYEDLWAEDLRKTGFYLGKFIYLIDAYDDLGKDAESGNFNILLALKRSGEESFDGEVKEILMDTAACCCRCFEYLPIVKNVEILRNILYSGIWVRFREITQGADRKKRSSLCDTELSASPRLFS